MREINIPVHADQLKALADRFEAFRTELASTAPLTGTDGLHQLTRHLRTSHELTFETLTQLTALDGSQATRMNGALAALDCLAQIVQQAGLVSENLTAAVSANAYDGTSWSPAQDTDAIGRGLRHLDARNAIATQLAETSPPLEICAEGCRIVSDHLTKHFPRPAPSQTRAHAVGATAPLPGAAALPGGQRAAR